MNKAILGMHVHIFIGYVFPYILGKYKGVELLDAKVGICVTLLRSTKMFF